VTYLPYDLQLVAGQAYPSAGDVGRFVWEQPEGELVDLTGYTAALEIRRYAGGPVVLTLTDASGVALGGPAGTIVITFTSGQTTALGTGFYPYQLSLTPSGSSPFVFMSGYVRVE